VLAGGVEWVFEKQDRGTVWVPSRVVLSIELRVLSLRKEGGSYEN
jgi:hypothetical protein